MRLCEEYSEVIDILASVIQGSALGPATFVINGGDLHPVVKGNDLLKYADDTYPIVPAKNSSCEDELQHIKRWATVNNLHLSQSKSAEIIFPVRAGCIIVDVSVVRLLCVLFS